MAVEIDDGHLKEEYFNSFMDEDNITKDWLLSGTPYPVITILALYLLFVLRIGPQGMANRSPYKLQTIMRLYNVFQILYNMYFLSIGANYEALLAIMNNACTISNHGSYKNQKYIYLLCGWHYSMLKMLDLLDTVFLVLMKKNSNITFLHVFHHVSMVFLSWLNLSYLKAISGAIPGLINAFVHVIMYAYYFLSTFSQCKPYLWWKQHLTKLQIGQFVVILLYVSVLYYKGCQMSRVFTYVCLGIVSVILVLFVDFYRKQYGSRDIDKRAKSS